MRFAALALIAALAPFAAAQSEITTTYTATLPPFVPNGFQNSSASLESTLPIECIAGCEEVTPVYFFCFVNTTLPNGQQNNITECLTFLCQQTNYDLLSQCLNCIVANGNERPFGYSTNTSMTAAPMCTARHLGPCNPNGLVNSTQANGILTNVTDRCAALNASVTGPSTVTATPTTTGPYTYSWTSGATVSISVWTGLTSYTSALDRAYQTNTVNVTLTETPQSSSPLPMSTSGGTGAGASSSAASASASAKSAGFRRASVPLWARLLSMLL